MREVRSAGSGLSLYDLYWALQAEGHQDRERRLPPLCLVRYLWEVRPSARHRHQSGHVVHRLRGKYVDLLNLRKKVICTCQLTQ